MRGKVVMEDGSTPNRTVGIERFCHDTGAQREAQTDKKGNYFWVMEIDPLSDRSCVLRASLDGYDSTVIDVSGFNWSTDPNLPPLVLRRREAGSSNRGRTTSSTRKEFRWRRGTPGTTRKSWRRRRIGRPPSASCEPRCRPRRSSPGAGTRWASPARTRTSRPKRGMRFSAWWSWILNLWMRYLAAARESIAAKDWSAAEKAAAALIKAGYQAALSGDLPAPGDRALLPEGSGRSGEQRADRHSPGPETRSSADGIRPGRDSRSQAGLRRRPGAHAAVPDAGCESRRRRGSPIARGEPRPGTSPSPAEPKPRLPRLEVQVAQGRHRRVPVRRGCPAE